MTGSGFRNARERESLGLITTPYLLVNRSDFTIRVHIDFASKFLFVHEQVRQYANSLGNSPADY